MKMKTNSILFLATICVAIVSIFSLIGFSYAQSSPNISLAEENTIFIFVQTVLQNSEGQVVAYLASNKFTFLDTAALDSLLNNEESENDPIIIIDGKNFQVIERKITIIQDKQSVIASTLMAQSKDNTLTFVARFAHDGYPILEGEKVTSVWTFIRPID